MYFILYFCKFIAGNFLAKEILLNLLYTWIINQKFSYFPQSDFKQAKLGVGKSAISNTETIAQFTHTHTHTHEHTRAGKQTGIS